MRHAVLLLTVGFLVGFRVAVSDGKVSIRLSHHIKFDSLVCCIAEILGILGLFFFCY